MTLKKKKKGQNAEKIKQKSIKKTLEASRAM